MLTNSDQFLCSNFCSAVRPISAVHKLSIIPRNIMVSSLQTFIFCDSSNQKTKIIEMSIQGDTQLIQQFDGNYTGYDFCNDFAMLINRDGDIMLYNFLSKNSFLIEKQHPGLYSDAEILHSDQTFITCGGCLKNPVTNNPERIIKVWTIDEQDHLQQKSRINTGHSKPIESSILFNKASVATFSTDKSLRLTNLVMQHLDRVISVDFDILSGCALDYTSLITGGTAKKLGIYDFRMSRGILAPIKIESEMVQITSMRRFCDSQIIFSNVNQICTLDLRNMKIKKHQKYEGQRISDFKVLNKRQFVVCNKERTLQVWQAY